MTKGFGCTLNLSAFTSLCTSAWFIPRLWRIFIFKTTVYVWDAKHSQIIWVIGLSCCIWIFGWRHVLKSAVCWADHKILWNQKKVGQVQSSITALLNWEFIPIPIRLWTSAWSHNSWLTGSLRASCFRPLFFGCFPSKATRVEQLHFVPMPKSLLASWNRVKLHHRQPRNAVTRVPSCYCDSG